MAVLVQPQSGQRVSLSARTIVGRSAGATLTIARPAVSGEHAAIRWTGEHWRVRDLGSRNGTWLDGHKLEPGEEAVLTRGSRLAFGEPKLVWKVEELSPPTARARRLADGVTAEARGGVLLLPDAEAPEVALFARGGVWVAERDGGAEVVGDGAVLTVDGQPWHLLLPEVLDPTLQAGSSDALRFEVSRDEEYVELSVLVQDEPRKLPPRTYQYLLLTLARGRLDDAHLPESSRGWVDQDVIAERLGLEPRTVNVQVFRARREVGEVAPDLAAASSSAAPERGSSGSASTRSRSGASRNGVGLEWCFPPGGSMRRTPAATPAR